MKELFQQLINGLSLGSIYALIALGYTMVYGIINLINFAHGDIYMVGAYVGFAVTTFLHLDFFTSLVISMLVCAALGICIEKVAYKPIRNSTRIAALITAISVSLFLEYVREAYDDHGTLPHTGGRYPGPQAFSALLSSRVSRGLATFKSLIFTMCR
jgi:branched-subunit amino acid ABC-type transport system permease component